MLKWGMRGPEKAAARSGRGSERAAKGAQRGREEIRLCTPREGEKRAFQVNIFWADLTNM
jgi:hypothetical protein